MYLHDKFMGNLKEANMRTALISLIIFLDTTDWQVSLD